MNIVHTFLTYASDFQHSVNHEMFLEIFGERVGNHLWDKFVYETDRNILSLWRVMDKKNRVKLSSWMTDNMEDIKFLGEI